jgi:hypothetical protein
MSWARLLKRVLDIEHCPNCGGEIIAAIEDPGVMVRILSHVGLPARGDPARPAAARDAHTARTRAASRR